jgi:hypothetical protein
MIKELRLIEEAEEMEGEEEDESTLIMTNEQNKIDSKTNILEGEEYDDVEDDYADFYINSMTNF